MLVDDAPIIRLMLRDIIEKDNIMTIIAECNNGQEAIDNYKKLQPDLVLMDIIMPQVNGLEALEKIKEINPNAKVIMITAIDQKESLLQAIKLGATDYIVKPFDEKRVSAALKKY